MYTRLCSWLFVLSLWLPLLQGWHLRSLPASIASSTATTRVTAKSMIAQNLPPFHTGNHLSTSASVVSKPVISVGKMEVGPPPNDLYCPVIVGIAGGSASGKSTLAKAIIEKVGEEHISLIGHDNYYKNLCHLSIEERAKVNFDHPDSLDTDLLVQHIRDLKDGKGIEIPSYDFATHSRRPSTIAIAPRKIILVDGILIFSESELTKLMDMKIFVDTDDDIRLIRRIRRDTIERGRDVNSIIDQYVQTVRPMHELYVEPSKRKADIIVPAGQGIQPAALEMCVSRLREIINFYQ